MAQIHYDRDVKEIINSLSTSTNVLENYDNVTYNITLYMYDYETEKRIDKDIAAHGGFISENIDENKKIIIAQSGVTLNFVIDSLLIKSMNGTFNNPINVQAYEMNLKIREPMGANLTNALDISAYALGYPTHLERPYWIDIYFTGYEHGTMKPIKKIPLDGSLKELTYRGMFGDVKSSVDNLGTTWDMKFYPYAQKFTNKNINYLRITSEFSTNERLNLEQILKRLIELMKKDYIESFSESDRKIVEGYLSKNNFINITARFNGAGKELSQIVIDPNTSPKGTKNNDIILKIDKNEFFTTAIQKILTKCSGDAKSLVTSFIINPKMGVEKNVTINTYDIIIEFYEDPIMKEVINNGSKLNEARREYIRKSKDNKSLFKKYIFGFSGLDTSVLEIHNVYDLLWYTTSVMDAEINYNRKNANLIRSQTGDGKSSNKNNIVGTKDNDSKDNNLQKTEISKEALSEIRNYFIQNRYVEDMFYDKYEEIIRKISGQLSLEIPERNNKHNFSDSAKGSSSEAEEYDNQSIVSDTMFNKLYKSGQLSTTKFTIIADPYWLIPYSVVNTKENLKVSNVMSEEPGARNYKCAFELRTFYKQVKNYKNEQAGFIDGKQTLGADYAMNTTLNVSGIYIIYQVETKLEDGKFTQTLEGVLDPHFFNNF